MSLPLFAIGGTVISAVATEPKDIDCIFYGITVAYVTYTVIY